MCFAETAVLKKVFLMKLALLSVRRSTQEEDREKSSGEHNARRREYAFDSMFLVWSPRLFESEHLALSCPRLRARKKEEMWSKLATLSYRWDGANNDHEDGKRELPRDSEAPFWFVLGYFAEKR
jgi:hypothetical protein